jgi:hypothetical protein
MGRQRIDVKRIIFAAFITGGVGVALVILSIILQLLSLAITDENGPLMDSIFYGYRLILFPIFLILFFWTGMRAVRRYGFDAVGAATVTALAYFIVALVEKVLDTVLAIIVVSRPLGGGGFGSAESAVAASLFGGAVGLSGVGLSLVCGIGLIILGTMINFVIGGFGALFALRKSSGSNS